MKKFLYSFLAVGALAGLASCASDEPMVRDNDGRVSFAINLPTMGTRAFGDTPECDQLTYTVYDEDGNVVIEDTTVPAFGPGVTQDNVTLQLVKNQSYRIVFYANNSKSTFAEYKAGSITVNYENLQVNNEQDDAFFRSYPFTVDGTEQVVKLYRPFAQVNIGTDDLDAPAVKHIISNLKTTLTVTQGLYGEMNLKDSTLVETSAVTDPTVFSVTGAAENTDFPVSGYSNLLSVYMLVPTGQNMIDATCVMDNNGKEINTLNLASTPVQLNYRTNIYGTLLTTQQPFNVIIEPAFNQPDYVVEFRPKSPSELNNALQSPVESKIYIDEDLDASNLPQDAFNLSAPKTIEIADDAKLVMPANVSFNTSNDLTIEGGTITNMTTPDENASTRADVGNTVEIGGTIYSPSTPSEDGSILLIKVTGGTLTIKNATIISGLDYHYHGQKYNSSAIAYQNDAVVNIIDSKIYSGEFAIYNIRVNAAGQRINEGVVNLENSYFESYSSVANNGKNWAYCVRLGGKSGVVDNCTIVGIQGALSVEQGMPVTINGGLYYTHNSTGKTDAFYAVYVTDLATVTINSGYFYGANNRDNLCKGTSCVVSGDNDVDMPSGSIIINGGYFSGIAYNHVTRGIYGDVDDYQVVNKEYEGMTFKYEYVK